VVHHDEHTSHLRKVQIIRTNNSRPLGIAYHRNGMFAMLAVTEARSKLMNSFPY